MKTILFILLVAFVAAPGFAQTKLHPIVMEAKETSYYSNGLDWESINKGFNERIGNGNSVDELKPGLQFLINSLGDKHGGFRSAKDHSLVVSYTGKTDPDSRRSNFVNTVINDMGIRFSFKNLGDGIGYLKVVAIGGMRTVKEEADFIREGLNALVGDGVKKWIVDLRYNGGGNINPMISGLAPLIGEGHIGGSVDAQNNLVYDYEIRKGEFIDNERLSCEMDNKPSIDPTAKVVVLLSRYTISSGELLAVAFKGRPNTRFIGESSAGYTTGNGFSQVTDDLFIVISQAVYVDRDGNIYNTKVGVDEEIEFQHQLELDGDKQVERAKEWLNTP